MNRRTGASKTIASAVVGATMVLAACLGEGGQPEAGGPMSRRAELAPSTLTASLNGGYKVKPNGSRVPPKQEELPVPIGAVEAHWYRAGGVYVIAFGGLDADETGPICPGSSIQTDSGFEHVTNSPTEKGACEGAPSIASSGSGVRLCGPLVLYVTDIPEDSKGDLFASVETYAESGKIVGVTGVVAADRSMAPQIDPDASGFALPPHFLEGATEVTC